MAASALFGGVLAADLSSFNSMTTANTVIVVGANAKTSDVVGGINIAAALARHGATAKVSGSGTITEVTGGVALDNPNEKLYLGDAINTVKDVLTAKDLPNILAKGTFQDDNGVTYDYSQYIDVGNNKIVFAQEESGQNPVVEIKMSTSDTDPLYTLEVDFNKQVDFTSDASKGQTIKLFGQTYTIGPETDNTKLVLYKASQQVTLNKGQETTVTVGGKTYTIKVLGFDSSTYPNAVVLNVNGDTDSIQQGVSKTVGGLQIYAKTVTSWDNGNEGIAILQVGSEKVTLENGQPVMVGDDNTDIDGTMVEFSGTPSALSAIKIKVYAPDADHDYIAAGQSFTDPFTGAFKVVFGGITPDLKASTRDVIKLRTSGDYKGYVTFKDINGNQATVYFLNAYKTGETTPSGLYLEDSDKYPISVVEGTPAKEDDLIFLAPDKDRYTHLVKIKDIHMDDTDGYVTFTDVVTGETYQTEEGAFVNKGDHLKLIVDGKTYTVTLVDNNTTSPEITVADDDGVEVVYPTMELNNGEDIAFFEPVSSDLIGALTDGEKIALPTGDLNIVVNTSASDSNIVIDGNTITYDINGTANYTVENIKLGRVTYEVNASTNGTDAFISIKGIVANGNIITNPSVILVEEEDNNNVKNAVIVPAEAPAPDYKVTFDAPIMTADTKWTDVPTANDDVTAYLDYYGTYAEYDTSSSDHHVVTIWYPDTQVTAQVAIGPNPQFGGTSSANAEITFPALAGTGIGVLDTEAAPYKGTKNLILVGGPYVNSLVAELAQAGKTPTKEEWRAKLQGKAIIQEIDNPFGGDKIAIIVAGWSAQDTREAAMVLATKQLTGKAVEIVNGNIEPFTYPFTQTTSQPTNSTNTTNTE